MFPRNQTQAMHSWHSGNGSMFFSAHHIQEHTSSTCPTTSDVNRHHLAKLVSAKFCHWNFTMFPCYLITLLWEALLILCQCAISYETSTHKTASISNYQSLPITTVMVTKWWICTSIILSTFFSHHPFVGKSLFSCTYLFTVYVSIHSLIFNSMDLQIPILFNRL